MGIQRKTAARMSPTHSVLLFISIFSSSVSCYPGALCNVTYNIPLPCDQVFSALTVQMKDWDEDSECPGQCEQRHFLEDKRGPPLTPVTLEGQESHVKSVLVDKSA